MPGPLTYGAFTDRDVRTKPTLPTLGVAGTIITDPTFDTRILRVSDANTQGGVSIRSIGGAGNTQAFNTTATRFITTNTSGGCLLWSFNAATMQAAFIKALNFNAGANASFSLVDPNMIYGFSTSFVEATITRYNCQTDSYSTVIGVRTLVPTVDDLGRTFIRGASVGVTGGVEYLNFIFGGTGQDHDFYSYWGPLNNIAGGKILNTRDTTIQTFPGIGGGTPTPSGSPLGVFLHAGFVDMTGRYVLLGPSTSVSGTFGQPVPPYFIWDTTTDVMTLVSGAGYAGPDSGGGHGASGYGNICNFPDDSDGFDSKFRTFAAPHTFTQLMTSFNGSSDFQIANHASWSNADPVQRVPILAAWYRYPSGSGPSSYVPNSKPWRTWDEEVLMVATDGSGIVYRLCHHRSDTNNRNDATDDWFWSLPRPNVSQDGKWGLFTSNWDKTLGNDTGETSHRQDVFIVEALAQPQGATSTHRHSWGL